MAVRDALDVLNTKWKLPIIIALSEGPKRFVEYALTATVILCKR
jgi:DNA-binding HxlR family transcriptional regulator